MSLKKIKIGVLALQGDVREHVWATGAAAQKLKVGIEVIEARTPNDLNGLDAIILPGGESTTIWKLLEREKMLEACAGTQNIFGTCAGLILMSKKIGDGITGQGSFGALDIDVQRNVYGPQVESFEQEVDSVLGKMNVAFIRAPEIRKAGKGVRVVARLGGKIVGVEQTKGKGKQKRYFLGLAFHPEITKRTEFHELFLKNVQGRR